MDETVLAALPSSDAQIDDSAPTAHWVGNRWGLLACRCVHLGRRGAATADRRQHDRRTKLPDGDADEGRGRQVRGSVFLCARTARIRPRPASLRICERRKGEALRAAARPQRLCLFTDHLHARGAWRTFGSQHRLSESPWCHGVCAESRGYIHRCTVSQTAAAKRADGPLLIDFATGDGMSARLRASGFRRSPPGARVPCADTASSRFVHRDHNPSGSVA